MGAAGQGAGLLGQSGALSSQAMYGLDSVADAYGRDRARAEELAGAAGEAFGGHIGDLIGGLEDIFKKPKTT